MAYDPTQAAVQQMQQSEQRRQEANRPKGLVQPRKQLGEFQGGLQTDFSGYGNGSTKYDASGYDPGGYAKFQRDNAAGGNDSDVSHALSAAWELQNPNEGTNGAEQTALLNMYKTRIGLKNSLAEQIGAAPDQLNQAQDANKLTSGSAVDAGLKHTRENYNGRGLLYSGAREGGEQAVKSAGASQLASSMASTARESANSVNAAKQAYASVDLANQQEMLTKANQAFDTANANSIARMQAMQELGQGLGQAAGSIYGSYNKAPSTTQPGGLIGSDGYSQGLAPKTYDQIMGRP